MTINFQACTLLFTALSMSAGCVAGDEESDGIDDSFLGEGKADAFGVREGSTDALAVLAMLRTASVEELDDGAELASHAAKAIVRHRQGPDRTDGTEDDDRIESLTELDAIPYVGPIAFRLLLDYARATVVAVRLRLAALLLSAREATIAEVAQRVGYGSVDALGRAFRDAGLPSPHAIRELVISPRTR